jgi:hypothetical protein
MECFAVKIEETMEIYFLPQRKAEKSREKKRNNHENCVFATDNENLPI